MGRKKRRKKPEKEKIEEKPSDYKWKIKLIVVLIVAILGVLGGGYYVYVRIGGPKGEFIDSSIEGQIYIGDNGTQIQNTYNIDVSEKNDEQINQKLDILIERDFEDILKREGVSLEQFRIITVDMVDYADDYFKKGDEYFRKGKYDMAVENYNKSVIFNYQSWGAWNNLGTSTLRLRGESSEEVLSYFDKAMNLAQNNSLVKYNYAYTLVDLGRWNESIKYFNDVTQLSPNNGLAWYYLAFGHYFANNYSLSRDAVNKARDLGVNRSPMWGLILDLSTILDDESGQLTTIKQITDSDCECLEIISQAWHNKGWIHYQNGEYPDALFAYKKSLEYTQDPAWGQAYKNIHDLIDYRFEYDSKILNCSKETVITDEIQVFEIPSLVYNETYQDGFCVGANLVYKKGKGESTTVTVFYGNTQLSLPYYRIREYSGDGYYNGPDMSEYWEYVDNQELLIGMEK